MYIDIYIEYQLWLNFKQKRDLFSFRNYISLKESLTQVTVKTCDRKILLYDQMRFYNNFCTFRLLAKAFWKILYLHKQREIQDSLYFMYMYFKVCLMNL